MLWFQIISIAMVWQLTGAAEGEVAPAAPLSVRADSSATADIAHVGRSAASTDATEEQAAAESYIANLNALIATRIIPDIRRGVIAAAKTRPPGLTIEVTDEPSPYRIGARVDPNGALRVRLSIGYMTMHDAALDAVALSAALSLPEQLRSYLPYQLARARVNELRQVRGESRQRAMNFAQFAQIDPKLTRALLAQSAFRQQRDRVEVDSLGWVIAYLLVRVDPRLGGASSPLMHDGRAAARLAASSGWFPVPPIATALGLAEMSRSTSAQASERKTLCRAANLVEDGVRTLKTNEPWRSRVGHELTLRRQVTDIQSGIARMRHDGHCESGVTASL